MFKNLSGYKLAKGIANKPVFARTGAGYSDINSQGFIATKASFSGYNTNQSSQSVNFANPTMDTQGPMRVLDGIVPLDNPNLLRLKYQDMYYFDNIAGTAVDLRAELPFSEFTLTGISDPAILKVYEECMEQMKVHQFLRRMMADYFVFGACAYQLIFNKEKKVFYSPRALSLNNCTFIQTPLLNDEPFIDYAADQSLVDFQKGLDSGDSRIANYMKKHPGLKSILVSKVGEKLQLDPETTLYLERNDLGAPNRMGTGLNQLSYYSRALKFYEYEKRIYRGTMDLAQKRLKSILHLQIGNESIFPEEQTLTHVANLFKTANLDPTDAIVATPYYVNASEVKNPTDFWRYDETYDFVSRAKLTALGINEEFLSGSANYSTMEMALSVFLEQLKSDRGYVTDYIFNHKIFPYLAKENNFIAEEDKSKLIERVKQESKDIRLNPFNQEKEYQKEVSYQIPGVHWHKSLKPQGDKDYMEMLSALKEQGIPIPMRMWIAGAGINVNEILDGLQEDEGLRERFSELGIEPEEGQGDFEGFTDRESERDGQDREEDRRGAGEEDGEPSNQGRDLQQEQAPGPGQRQEQSSSFNSGVLKPFGMKARARLGDLNSQRVRDQFIPHRESKGRVVALSRNEQLDYEERSNRVLADILAQRRERDIKEENKKYSEVSTKVIR